MKSLEENVAVVSAQAAADVKKLYNVHKEVLDAYDKLAQAVVDGVLCGLSPAESHLKAQGLATTAAQLQADSAATSTAVLEGN